MKLDRFDILNISAAAILLVAAAVVAATGSGDGFSKKAVVADNLKAAQDPAIARKIETARMLFDAGQISEAAAALVPITEAAPGLAEPHALLGQAYARLLDYPAAVRQFRYALLIDPDYVDGKSGKFIGKRIKAAVKECMPQFRDALLKNPSDQTLVAAMNDARYLERMLAGGCN